MEGATRDCNNIISGVRTKTIRDETHKAFSFRASEAKIEMACDPSYVGSGFSSAVVSLVDAPELTRVSRVNFLIAGGQVDILVTAIHVLCSETALETSFGPPRNRSFETTVQLIFEA